MLFKLIVSIVYVDTKATTTYIIESFIGLDKYMQSINSNVEKFNLYVKEKRNELAARGNKCDNLIHYPFRGYQAVDNKPFSEYIARKKAAYHDESDKTINNETLMTLALQQYKVLKQTGKWTAKSEEDKKILALSATVSKLQQQLKDKTKPKESTDTQQNKRNYAWKNKPPKGNQKKVKEVNGKTYHWCPYHGKEGKW